MREIIGRAALQQPLRAIRCARAVCALLLVLLLAMPWAMLPVRWRSLRRAIEVAGWTLLLAGFGVRVRRHGIMPRGRGTLFLSNHVSWLDIAVLARFADAGFVAKAEVAGWPVIGGLARRHGAVFVERDRRMQVRDSARALGAKLEQGQSIVVFAEGTTGAGDRVTPFRASLLGRSEARLRSVCPVTLAYRDPAERARAAWIGDAALLPHAMALAAAGGVTIDLDCGESFSAIDRKEATRLAEAHIAARLAHILGGDQAATLKRAA